MKITAKQYAQSLLAACEGKSKSDTDAIIDHFAKQAVHGGKSKLLKAVVAQSQSLEKKQDGHIDMTITHMPGVGSGIIEFVKKAGQRQGGKVTLSTIEDPTLIGGVKIRINDKEVDASLKGKLERLKYHLLAE